MLFLSKKFDSMLQFFSGKRYKLDVMTTSHDYHAMYWTKEGIALMFRCRKCGQTIQWRKALGNIPTPPRIIPENQKHLWCCPPSIIRPGDRLTIQLPCEAICAKGKSLVVQLSLGEYDDEKPVVIEIPRAAIQHE